MTSLPTFPIKNSRSQGVMQSLPADAALNRSVEGARVKKKVAFSVILIRSPCQFILHVATQGDSQQMHEIFSAKLFLCGWQKKKK